MEGSKEELLQKELAYYTSLLNKHELLGKTGGRPYSFQGASWKQPVLPAYKLVKNMPVPFNESKIQSSRKVILAPRNNFSSRKERTVLYSTLKPNVSSQPFDSNEIIKKRTVVDISSSTRTPVLIPHVSKLKPIVASVSAPKSQDLQKEMETLDILLKSTKNLQMSQPNKSTSTNFVAVQKSCKYKSTNDYIKSYGVNRFKLNAKNRSVPHIDSLNKTSNTFWASSAGKRKVLNQVPTDKTSKLEKLNGVLHNLKESETKNLPIPQNENANKAVGNSKKQDTLNKYISELESLKKIINPLGKQSKNSSKEVHFVKLNKSVKTPIPNNKTNAKVSSKYKIVNKHPLKVTKVKSPSTPKVKSSAVFKLKTTMAPKINKHVYSKVNNKCPSSRKRQHSENKSVSYKNYPVNKRMKKLNSKYKVINKTTQNLNLLQQKNKSKEKSILNMSSPSVELLDDSVINSLEKRLLVVSAAITSTPEVKKNAVGKTLPNSNSAFKSCTKKTPLKKCKTLATKYKVVNKNVTSKVNAKVHIKKTPVKRYKMFSKYKVVNKKSNASKNTPHKAKNTPKKVTKKLVLTKYSIVNKHSSTNFTTPKKSVLVQRLYKSKNVIINKNDSLTSSSAKMIKSKYLGRNRKSFQKHGYQKMKSPKLQKFKGQYARHIKTNGRFTKLNNGRYRKRNIYSLCMQKQSNVLTVRGTRYSLSSSGKKLRRLPTKGQTRTNKMPPRMMIGRRSYTKTSFNVMKIASPPSVNIASRVLHRSINRVLNASSRKSLTKVNTYCMFYNRFGRCNRGVKCTYIHDPSKIAVCTRFLRGTCKVEGCPFSHEVSPGKMAICSFYLMDACEKTDCPYRHEQLSPDAVLCKAFVQGYCRSGKECKKAHILICPKFILGECQKGSSCAFPHPPQKEKKNISKVEAAVDNKNVKKEDVLMESIARYFQSLNEPSETCNLFVPIRKRLEEQPAFIPLCGSASVLKET